MRTYCNRHRPLQKSPLALAWRMTSIIGGCCLMLLGSLLAVPAGAQNKASALIEFVPAAVSTKMAGDAKIHTIKRSGGNGQLFSATAAGLQVSDDAGHSWQRLPVAGRDERILALETDPRNPAKLFVGRRDGLWLSSDGGRSWDALQYPGSVPVALAVAPSEPDTLYLATSRNGIHKSRNGGQSWQTINGGLPVNRAGNRAEQVDQLTIDPDNPNNVLASIERLGIFRTANGNVWDEFNKGLPYPLPRPMSAAKLAYDPTTNGGNVYLVMEHPIHSHLAHTRLFSLSDQQSWRPLRVRIPDNFSVKSIVVDGARQKLQLWSDQTVLEAPLPR
jgi:hypothetical protein